jgi:hypothetical protein
MVNTFKLEERLEGEMNFWASKARFLLLLEEHHLKEYVEDVVPSATNPVDLEFHKKREVKAKHMLLDAVKNHLIPHIAEKTSSKEMYDPLVLCLYQNGNTGRKFYLKQDLQVVKMSSEHTVVNYLIKITHI